MSKSNKTVLFFVAAWGGGGTLYGVRLLLLVGCGWAVGRGTSLTTSPPYRFFFFFRVILAAGWCLAVFIFGGACTFATHVRARPPTGRPESGNDPLFGLCMLVVLFPPPPLPGVFFNENQKPPTHGRTGPQGFLAPPPHPPIVTPPTPYGFAPPPLPCTPPVFCGV